jgi:hypothetical protein
MPATIVREAAQHVGTERHTGTPTIWTADSRGVAASPGRGAVTMTRKLARAQSHGPSSNARLPSSSSTRYRRVRALFLARAADSVEGVDRVADAFASLGQTETLRAVAKLAASADDPAGQAAREAIIAIARGSPVAVGSTRGPWRSAVGPSRS